jgi:hypothetical protein
VGRDASLPPQPGTRAELPVSDLSVLASLKSLQHLVLDDLPVADPSPLRGLPVDRLGIVGTKVTDLTPLKGLPLYHLVLDYRPEYEKLLRSIPTLTEINLFGLIIFSHTCNN